jgi:type I restriction enzyme S subunit
MSAETKARAPAAELRTLPGEWSWASVGELSSLVQYGTSSKTSEDPSGVPVLRMGNIVGGQLSLENLKYLPHDHPDLSALVLEPGDILFNRTNSAELVGKTAVYSGHPKVCSFASYLIRVRLKHCYEPALLSHYLNSVYGKAWITSVVSQQVGQANVNGSKLKALSVPVPPRDDQRHIVAEIEKQFTRLDAAVAALKRAQANLKRYRTAVLKAACEGRLVPTEAELARAEGRDYEPAENLLQRILKDRRERWGSERILKVGGKSSGDGDRKARFSSPSDQRRDNLPALPEGWARARWKQVGQSKNGRAFPSKRYQDFGIRLLRPGNLFPDGRVLWNEKNTRYLPEEFASENQDLIVGREELVINLTAQSLKDEFLGRVCLTGKAEYCLLNQRLAKLSPITVPVPFMLLVFKSPVFRGYVDGLNTGSLIQHMFTSQLEDFAFPLPPLAEQHRIIDEVQRRLSVLDQLEAATVSNLRRAERLRRAILRRAFEGRLAPQDSNGQPTSTMPMGFRGDRCATTQMILDF